MTFDIYPNSSVNSLRGQTLIEVLVSLSILSLVFVLGLMLFQQISGIHAPAERQQTRMMLASFLQEPFYESDHLTEREIRGRTLVRRIQLMDRKRALFKVEVSAYWRGKLLEKRWKVRRNGE